jgi:hypothetical protein
MSAQNHLSALGSIILELEIATQSHVDLEAKLIEDKVVIKALSDHRDHLLAEVRLLNFAQQSCLEPGAKSNDEAIQLQRILDDLDEKKVKFALAIIDACRDNPFKSSGRALGGRGLAPTTAATGQMVMFSAGAGQQALDKLGANDKEKNGLFTRLFIKEMVKPGIPVDKVLRNVRNEVVRLAKTVGHEQTPALYDQAIGDFYFLQ